MAQSLSRVLIHVIFSTKDHSPVLGPILHELFPVISTILTDLRSTSITVGGWNDHLHILCGLGRDRSIAQLVQVVKVSASTWIKQKYPHLTDFSWQPGYGAFSVSQSEVNRVTKYIETQDEHHKKMSAQDEFVKFLEKHGVQYDPKYLWTQSWARILIHIIFSTKDRSPVLGPVLHDLFPVISRMLRDEPPNAPTVGGWDDHLHILCGLGRDQSVAHILQTVKVSSAMWIKQRSPEMIDFSWQPGYGAFSVSHSEVERVSHYIETQDVHHKKISFQDELVKFLEKHDVQYDPKYLWTST